MAVVLTHPQIIIELSLTALSIWPQTGFSTFFDG